jgi:hypothetical protein
VGRSAARSDPHVDHEVDPARTVRFDLADVRGGEEHPSCHGDRPFHRLERLPPGVPRARDQVNVQHSPRRAEERERPRDPRYRARQVPEEDAVRGPGGQRHLAVVAPDDLDPGSDAVPARVLGEILRRDRILLDRDHRRRPRPGRRDREVADPREQVDHGLARPHESPGPRPLRPVPSGEHDLRRIEPPADAVLDHLRLGLRARDPLDAGKAELSFDRPGRDEDGRHPELLLPGRPDDRVERPQALRQAHEEHPPEALVTSRQARRPVRPRDGAEALPDPFRRGTAQARPAGVSPHRALDGPRPAGPRAPSRARPRGTA